jgi:hypothetical protein
MRVVTPEEIEATARAIVSARTTNLGIEVTTPVVYPNGNLVTVAVTVEGGEYEVHDAGFGAMYLNSSGIRLTRQLTHRFAELASRYGCEFIAGRMTRRCSPEQVAMAAVMVANASRTVGDQALEMRRSRQAAHLRGADRMKSQGLCDTTLTERFDLPCVCDTYPGNLGPCIRFEEGASGRCVYCEHAAACHPKPPDRSGATDQARAQRAAVAERERVPRS